MNYYQRHLGDYAKDTGHLSLLEHGAYTLLIDRYYVTERPIPDADVYRVARAQTRAERDAVDAVLREFFVHENAQWSHGRIEREIERAGVKGSANRENGKKGGRPKKGDESGDKAPPCPQKEIIAAYHRILPELPVVNEWPDVSADNLRARWKTSKERQNVDWWCRFFEYVRKSDFLMGERGDFQASLVWLVKASNFAKVINGNYDNRGRA